MENVYAALLLHKLGKEVSEDNIKKVMTAAGADISSEESKIKSLVASLNGVDIDKELETASLVSVAPTGDSGKSHEAKAEPKAKEEKKEESAAEGLSALFG